VPTIDREDVQEFERCIGRGGVAVFPADTVYGLACNPGSTGSVERMYTLKGRPVNQPSAVMFFQLDRALAAFSEIGSRTLGALGKLLPGAVTVVLPNPDGRYALAGGTGVGLRVPLLEGAAALLAEARVAVLQTSANPSGRPPAHRLGDVDAAIREGVDIVLDGGELSGTPSTVVDLTRFEQDGSWEVLREGAVSRSSLTELLSS
jgi:L-threonylcarbamoyladenylate synthase